MIVKPVTNKLEKYHLMSEILTKYLFDCLKVNQRAAVDGNSCIDATFTEQVGMDCRNIFPYLLERIRRSKITTTPGQIGS